ncbi:MAG: hypothetical protein V5A62_19730, partial [Haloarculaceae archaeon]
DESEEQELDRPDRCVDHVTDDVEPVLDDGNASRLGKPFDLGDVTERRSGRREFHPEDVARREDERKHGCNEAESNSEPDRNCCDDDETAVSPQEATERILRWTDRVAEAESDDEQTDRMDESDGETETDGSSGGHAFDCGLFWLLCSPEKTSRTGAGI